MTPTNISTNSKKAKPLMVITTLLAVVAGMALNSSCMMLEMCGMSHDSHGGHEKQKDLTVEAENKDIRVSLNIPKIIMGKEAEMTVKVQDHSGVPISGAKVTFKFDDDEDLNASNSTGNEEKPAAETLKKGIYSLKQLFEDHGIVRLTAKIIYNSEPLIVAAPIEIIHAEKNNNNRLRTTVMILGITAMAAMMVFMIGRNF